MTTYTCLACDARWERERRRGASLVHCPNGHDWTLAREAHTCETCLGEWDRVPTKGPTPKSCPSCRTGKGRKLRVKCWVCGEACIKTSARVRSGRVTCGAACKAACIVGLGYYPSRKDFEAGQRPVAEVAYSFVCWCGVEVEGIAPSPASVPSYCSSACKARRKRHAHRDDPPARFVAGTCQLCGEAFIVEWQTAARFCSDYCTRKHNHDRRRARVRNAYVEPVAWRSLYREHGPECYLCGVDTDPEDFAYGVGRDGRKVFLAGPNYPTLDHVVALNNGGEHSKANARLAHLLCNSIKSDRAV